MERLKRGLVFWVLLLISVAMPASGQIVKKTLYQAKLKVDGGSTIVGGSLLQPQPGFWDIDTHSNPGSGVVTRVNLRIEGDSREIVLCDNAGTTACTYGADGLLDLTSVVNGDTLLLAGITGAQFSTAMKNGQLLIEFDNGAVGSGAYLRIF